MKGLKKTPKAPREKKEKREKREKRDKVSRIPRKAFKNLIDNPNDSEQLEAFKNLIQSQAPPTIVQAPQDASIVEERKDSSQVTMQFVNKLMRGIKVARGGRRAREGRDQVDQAQENLSEEQVIELFQKKIGEWRLWATRKPDLFQKTLEWCDYYFRNYDPTWNWKDARAVCQRKPEGVLQFAPGMTQTIELEVLNDTYWPWAADCILNLADEQPCGNELPIDAFSVNIEEKVKGKTSTTVSVPLTMAQSTAVDVTKEYEIMLTFRNPKGSPFGTPIPLRMKCVSELTTPGGTIQSEQSRINSSIQVVGAGQVWKP